MTAGIRSGTNNDGYIQVNGNDIITALSSGNVGIGNTSPSTKLQVNGTVTATNFAGNISGNTTISGDITIPEKIIHTGDTGTFMKFNTDEIVFETGASSKVFINDTGDLTVGASEGNLGKVFIKQAANTDTEGFALLNSGGGNSFRLFLGDSSGAVAHLGHGGQKQLNVTQAGNVGIGVAGPNRKFQVKSAGTNAVQMSLLDNDSTNEIWRVGQATDGDGYVEVLEDGGTVGCKLDASGNSFTLGNFGVGTASPGVKLHVDSGSSYSVGTFNSSHSNGILINLQRSGTNTGFIGSGKNIADATGGVDDVGMRAQANLIFTAGGGTERARITSAGSLLLAGATTSTAHADADDLVLNERSGGNVGITFKNASTGYGVIYFADNSSQHSGRIQYDHSNDSLDLFTGGSEQASINSSGYLGVGVDPATVLHVKANVGDMLRLDRNNTGAVGNQIAFRHSASGTLTETGAINCVSTANAATGELRFYTKASGASNAEKLRMVSGGQLNIGGNFGQSEARLWVSDTTKTIAVGTVTIASTTSTGAADTGPVLRFYGHDGNTDRFHSSIKGAKENSTSGNYAGYITLNTRPNGSSMVERLRISSVGFTRFRCDTRFDREAYTRGGQIGEGGTTGNATGNDGTNNPGGFKFNFNTPVWGSNTHYKYWMQSGDNYPHASTFIELNIRNAFMYRVMIKGSHSSDTADMAMYMIYGLANNNGNQPPMVVRLDRNTGGNNNALESSSNDVSGTFSTSVQNYGGSNANGSYDTTLRITYNGNNNQGLVAFIEEFGNE